MRDLTFLFENFYESRDHSIPELMSYGAEHLIRVDANNPGGVFNAVLTELTAAYNPFVACFGDEEAAAAVRKSANQSRNNLKATFSGANGVLSKASAAVQAAFGKPSPDYTACFPLGLEGFARATLSQVSERFGNLHAALTARSAQVGAAHVTAVGSLKTSWDALSAAAGDAKGAETAVETTLKTCRENVTKAFSRAALYIAWHFNGDMSKAALYLPTHLLKNDEQQPPGAPTLVVHGGIGQFDVTATVSNADEVEIFLRPAAGGDYASVATGAPGEVILITGQALGVYDVKAVARNAAGDGPESDVVQVEVT